MFWNLREVGRWVEFEVFVNNWYQTVVYGNIEIGDVLKKGVANLIMEGINKENW